MTDRDDQDTKWQAIKAKGRQRFVLVNGVLGWGVALAFVTAIGRSLLAAGTFMDHFPRELIIALPIWMTVGALWAMLTWRGMEKAERRRLEQKDMDDA